jgi:nucleoside-diphosphate-sugar epimerase
MKILVTGATGFLGSRLLERLLELNQYDIIATGRDKIKAEKLKKPGVEVITGSLEEKNFVENLLKGVDIVVHSAALSSPWGKYQDFYRANIAATENIISASKKNNVKRIVHISTPSIYFDYTDRFNIMEDFVPEKFVNHYAETKYQAEKLITKAGEEGLESISLRPRAIVGAGDTTIMPRLLKAQDAGKLKIIGDGKNIVDVTSVSNVVDAIILSLTAPQEALGQKYNITNGDPIPLWELIEKTLEKLNLKLNKSRVPFAIAYNLAKVLETMAKFTPDYREPVLTCYGVGILAKSMTMNIDKAKNLLGYQPKQKNMEAVDEFVNWWKTSG